MSMEHNRRVAIRMVEQIARGIIDDELVTADVCWWVPGMGTLSRAEFSRLVDGFTALRQGPCTMTIHGITAEGDRVAVEAESHAELKNGEVYNNTYHFLFEFENGRIRLAKEYNDSAYANAVLERAGGLG